MFERDGVVAAIALVLERARAGQGQALFVIGEAGLGKTSVLEQAREQAAGFAVGVGRGQAMEATLHFGIVSEALRAIGAGTPLDVPRSAASVGLDARAAYFYATLRHLESRRQPALLLLDDLHWADPDSLALVSFLSHRLAALPVALVATLRPWPRAALDLARHQAQQGQAQLEQLMPLSAPAASALLTERVGGELPDDTLGRAWAASGGNPLFLEEIARHLREGRSMSDLDERGNEATLLLSRIAGPGADLRYAHAASVFGIEFRPVLAARVAGLDEREATEALAVLVDTGLVRPGQAGWAQFTHPLFQQALYEDMSSPVRERWHAAAFRHLMAHGVEPGEAADHAVSGQLVGDPQAIAVLQRAGRAALADGAVATARQRLQAAVTLAGDSPSPQLLTGLAETLLSTGEAATAVAIYGRILEASLVDGGARAHVHRMLGRALFVSGDARAADAQFAAAADLGRAGSDPTPAVEALLDHSTACWIAGRIEQAVDYATRARDLAQVVDPDVRRRAESNWALVTFISGSAEGLPTAAAAAAAAELNPLNDTVDPTWGWGPLGNYMFMAEFAEAYDEAARVRDIAYHAAELLGAPMAIGLLDSLRVNALIRQGRLAEALLHAEHASRMAELVPSLAGYAWIANAATVLEMGRTDEAAAWCDRLEKLPQLLILSLWVKRIRGVIAGRRGHQQQASDLFLVAEKIANQAGLLEPCVVPWSRDAITAHVACGRLDDAARVVAWLEARSAALPCRWPRASAMFGRAQLAERAGENTKAEALYREALTLYSQVNQPLSEIRTMIFFGRFLRQVGKSVEARPYLTRAADVATVAGAGWLAQQATDELHAAGGRQRRHVSPDDLTPQERRVAKLAIDGLKVREIAEHLSLSPRTVETHLQKVYQKRNVSSQIELIKSGIPEAAG
ncbi:MAG TPA: AAA family ATPase [Candidatus Dormibacteraeota bacterium]|nr:AAA family ATPase [Candidatus Dormibacteraeota bacterium]